MASEQKPIKISQTALGPAVLTGAAGGTKIADLSAVSSVWGVLSAEPEGAVTEGVRGEIEGGGIGG